MTDLIADHMTTEVLTVRPDDLVPDAVKVLVDHGIDGAPVVSDEGEVLGMLSASDVMIQDAQVHLPTVITMFGATMELPVGSRRYDQDLRRALASTVRELMGPDPVTIRSDATVGDAATAMHDNDVSRLPVLDEQGHLVGIIARGDVLRYLVGGKPEQAV